MDSRQKLFLLLSLIAVFSLLLLSQVIEPKILSISNITADNLDQLIKVEGKFTNQKNYDGKSFQVLILKDSTDNIQVTTNAKNQLELNYSQTYAVIGKVSEYNRTLQISANKIERVPE